MCRGDTMAGNGQWRAAGAALGRIILQVAGNGLARPRVGATGLGLLCVCRLPARRDGPATTSVCHLSHNNTPPPLCAFILTALLLVLDIARRQSSPSAPSAVTASDTRCVTAFVQRKFTHAPVGRALLPLPASTGILARWTCKAKLAGPRSKHTTYPLIPTQHCLVHLPSPSLHFPSCARRSWTSTPSTLSPRSRVPRVRLSRSPVTSPSPSPLLHSSVERVKSASSRELRLCFARPASCMPVDSPVLSACISQTRFAASSVELC